MRCQGSRVDERRRANRQVLQCKSRLREAQVGSSPGFVDHGFAQPIENRPVRLGHSALLQNRVFPTKEVVMCRLEDKFSIGG